MRLTNQISNFQKLELNYPVLPTITLSSVVFTILGLEIISRIKQMENIFLNPVKIKRVKLVLFTTSFSGFSLFFGLIVQQQEELSSSTTKKTLPLLPFPRLTNKKNNCFIHVIIQMIFSNSVLAEPLLHSENLRALYDQYQKACKKGCTTELGSSFRKLHQDFNNSSQHDPFEFFYKIFIEPLKENARTAFPFFKIILCSYPQIRQLPEQNVHDSIEQITFKEDFGTIFTLHFPDLKEPVPIKVLIQNTCYESCDLNQKLPYKEIITRFTSPPQYLVISLARFKRKNGRSCKITTPFFFTPTFLIPAAFNEENKPVHYRWLSFIIHTGHSLEGGHYVSYHQARDGSYYCCNDSHITEISEQEFKKNGKMLYGGIAERIQDANDPLNAEESSTESDSSVDSNIEAFPHMLTQENLSIENGGIKIEPLTTQSSDAQTHELLASNDPSIEVMTKNDAIESQSANDPLNAEESSTESDSSVDSNIEPFPHMLTQQNLSIGNGGIKIEPLTTQSSDAQTHELLASNDPSIEVMAKNDAVESQSANETSSSFENLSMEIEEGTEVLPS